MCCFSRVTSRMVSVVLQGQVQRSLKRAQECEREAELANNKFKNIRVEKTRAEEAFHARVSPEILVNIMYWYT